MYCEKNEKLIVCTNPPHWAQALLQAALTHLFANANNVKNTTDFKCIFIYNSIIYIDIKKKKKKKKNKKKKKKLKFKKKFFLNKKKKKIFFFFF